jgi:hypothetical protein
MVVLVEPAAGTPELSAAHQTQEAQELKQPVVLVVSRQVTAFRALQAANILVVILAMNQAVAEVATSAEVAAEITAVAVAVQATSIRALSLTLSHRRERSMFRPHQQVSSTLFLMTAMETPVAPHQTIVNSRLLAAREALNQILQG